MIKILPISLKLSVHKGIKIAATKSVFTPKNLPTCIHCWGSTPDHKGGAFILLQ